MLSQPLARVRQRHRQSVMSARIPEARLKIETVVELTGLSESSIWRGVKTGVLPTPVRDGPRCTRWVAADVMEYLRKRGAA